MRLLIDTHVLFWAVATPERLSDAAREALSTADHQVAIFARTMANRVNRDATCVSSICRMAFYRDDRS